MSLLSEIKAAVTSCGLPLETGVFSDEPPEEYVVVTPLADTYELHADKMCIRDSLQLFLWRKHGRQACQ